MRERGRKWNKRSLCQNALINQLFQPSTTDANRVRFISNLELSPKQFWCEPCSLYLQPRTVPQTVLMRTVFALSPTSNCPPDSFDANRVRYISNLELSPRQFWCEPCSLYLQPRTVPQTVRAQQLEIKTCWRQRISSKWPISDRLFLSMPERSWIDHFPCRGWWVPTDRSESYLLDRLPAAP